MELRILLLVLAVLFPVSGFATNFEISRLASQLQGLSADLSRESRGLRGFSSVSHYAARLESRADQLNNSITRGRSTSFIRSRFSDVVQHYERLEEAYFRAGRFRVTSRVEQQFAEISQVLQAMSLQFFPENYYPGYVGAPPVILYYPYRGRNAERAYQRNPQGGLDRVPDPQRPDRHRADDTQRPGHEPRYDHQSDVYDRQQDRISARIYERTDPGELTGQGSRLLRD